MYKKIRCLLLLLLFSCSFQPLSLAVVSEQNSMNVYKIKQGMSQSEVKKTMGDEPYNIKTVYFKNDYYEIWFYLVKRLELGQTKVTKRNLKPLIFINGILEGIGYKDYNKLKNEIREYNKQIKENKYKAAHAPKVDPLKIRIYGDKVLMQRSAEIPHIDDKITTLVNQMIVTLEKVNGAGLAANQVGEPVRLFIIRDVIKTKVTDKTGESKEKLTLGKPEVFINPVLSNPSKATTITRQGCLSLPDLSLDVERPSSIYIKALNIKGEPIEEMATGYKAVEIQHEYDHLNGILMVDKAKYKDRKEKKKVKKYLKELAKKQKELNKNIPEK